MRILIADDHALFRQGLGLVLVRLYEGAVVAEARDIDEAEARALAGPHYDVILLDLAMPGMDGWAGLARVLAAGGGVPVVILSATDEPDTVADALRHGAAGYIHKSCTDATLHHALSLVLAGETYVPARALRDRWSGGAAPGGQGAFAGLSPRQRDVLALMTKGHSNKEIARQLDVLESTVKAHIKVIFDKLGVANRTQAALKAAELARGAVRTGG